MRLDFYSTMRDPYLQVPNRFLSRSERRKKGRHDTAICLVSLAGAIASIVVLAGASAVSAMGYWNLPGNCCQWCGCGYSGGYHAPFVLGPINGGCCEAWNEVRLPYAPNPYACAPCHGGCVLRRWLRVCTRPP